MYSCEGQKAYGLRVTPRHATAYQTVNTTVTIIMPLIVVLIISVLTYLQPVGAHNASHENHTMSQAKNKLDNDTTGVRVFLPENHLDARIIGGIEAWANSWPWQVSLRFATVHACGGAIISAQWVVSAAHCFIRYRTPSFWTAMAGKHDLDNPQEACQQFREVDIIISHHHYHRIKKVNDIALVKLTSPFSFNECVRRIDILTGPLPVMKKCTITGWGSTVENGPHVSRLQEVNVTILPTQTCNRFYRGKVTKQMFCAGDQSGGVDACQGDSGGPLCCFRGRWYELAGLVSWGIGCGRVQRPGVYTKLQVYKGWISAQMQSYMVSYGASGYRSSASCGHAMRKPCQLSNTPAEVVERGKDGPWVLNVSTACPFSWPWQLSLQTNGQHYCSGTLINHNWLLAPRHCHPTKGSDVVALGVHDLTFMATQVVPLAEVITIKGAGGFPPDLDLSLIRLSVPARVGSTIFPVCLHHDDDEPDESWSCVTTGWGSTDAIRNMHPKILHQARINIVNMTYCRAAWGDELIRSSHICTTAAGSQACMGDSGGPLLCKRHEKYYLVGMATWSSRTCDPEKPAVFTRVSSFQSWITEMTET